MNIFGFRPFKGKFNLGNSDDIPENQDGTLIGSIKQINTALAVLNNEARVTLASISSATTFDSHALDSDKKLSDYETIGFSVLDTNGVVGVAFELSLAFLKGFTNYTNNRYIIGIAGANDTVVVTYVDDTHIIARTSSARYTTINVFGINSKVK